MVMYRQVVWGMSKCFR